MLLVSEIQLQKWLYINREQDTIAVTMAIYCHKILKNYIFLETKQNRSVCCFAHTQTLPAIVDNKSQTTLYFVYWDIWTRVSIFYRISQIHILFLLSRSLFQRKQFLKKCQLDHQNSSVIRWPAFNQQTPFLYTKLQIFRNST